VVGASTCQRHPGVTAGWRCCGCGAALCGGCATLRRLGATAVMTVCCACGDRAQRLTRPRAARPFTGWLRGLHRFPLGREVLPSLLALALLRALMSYGLFGPIGALLSAGSFWAYLFYIVRTSASGKTWLGVPDFRDVQEDLAGPAIKGAAATALIWGPALLYGLWIRGWSLPELGAGLLHDPVLWALVVIGAAYAPMAIIAAATDVGLAGMLNPLRIVGYIRRVGPDYAVATAVLAALALAQVSVTLTIVHWLGRLPLPLVSRILAEGAALYLPFMMARVLGQLLHVHGDALDWGSPEDYADPVVAGDPWGTPQRPAGALSPVQHHAAGCEAARAHDFPRAVRELRAAAESSDVIAARALVALAQVYGEGLADRAASERLYREAISRFPDSDAAEYAARKLALLAAAPPS
jgi:hypothetical protein